jgi:hypothetical protein
MVSCCSVLLCLFSHAAACIISDSSKKLEDHSTDLDRHVLHHCQLVQAECETSEVECLS